MYWNRLHAWWSTQLRCATLLSFLIHTSGSDFRLYDSSDLKTYLLMNDEMVGAWCFGWCQAHRGLDVGFLLLRYSVLCTVESLSLLYRLFISWFICSRRWCMEVRGLLCKPNICVSWSTSELRVKLVPWNRFKPSSKIFLPTLQRGYSFCGSFVLFIPPVCHAFVSIHCCLVVTRWERTDA